MVQRNTADASPSRSQSSAEVAAHTPTPWTVGHGPNKEVEIWGRMRMNTSPILMSLGVMEHDPREANAAFIVKAVNNHDALVEAVATACEYLESEDFRPAVRLREKFLALLTQVSA